MGVEGLDINELALNHLFLMLLNTLCWKQSSQFPRMNFKGYVELKDSIEKETGKNFNYNTLFYYCFRNFKSSVEVARKSHVKKDVDLEISFKKISDESIKK